MIQPKDRAFSIPVLRKRCKAMMKKKYGKSVKLSLLDKVWGDWVEYAVVKPLIQYGQVQIDEKTRMEIVGRRIINDPKAFDLISNGRVVTRKGRFIEAKELSHRKDINYKIIFKDDNYKKGQLIYESDRKLSKRISEHLSTTQQYYRIEK